MSSKESSSRGAGDTLRDRRIDFYATVLLSLATLASAWSAYQAARWSGVQAIRFGEANAARVKSEARQMKAVQLLSLDAGMFIEYAAAISTRNEKLSGFLFDRFRPEMKKALLAWLATRPLENPDAPSSPFAMKEYTLKAQHEAEELDARAEERFEAAKAANQTSDNYILLTVIFASVLFFAGVGSKFLSQQLRTGVLAIGTLAFLGAAVALSTFPIH